MCTTSTTSTDIRKTIATAVARMPAYEDRFWAEVDASGTSRAHAGRLLDSAVVWIASGRTGTVDPYALVLSWLPR